MLQEETVPTATSNAAESMQVDRMAGGDDIPGAGKEVTEIVSEGGLFIVNWNFLRLLLTI